MSDEDQHVREGAPTNDALNSKHHKWKQEAERTYTDIHSRCPGSNVGNDEATVEIGGPQSSGIAQSDGNSLADLGEKGADKRESEIQGGIECNLTDPGSNTGSGSTDHRYDKQLSVFFYLYTHDSADKVFLEFENPLMILSDLMYRMSSRGNCWRSNVIILHPNDVSNIRYRYNVKYHQNLWQKGFKAVKDLFVTTESVVKETRFRSFSGRNQYDIFHQPHNIDERKWIFEGQFYFVKMLYDSIAEGDRLKEILMEAEYIGFGSVYCRSSEASSFFTWVNQMSKSDLTQNQSVYICSLLGQFDKHRSSLFFKLLIPEEAVNVLLNKLRFCSRMFLPQSCLKYIKNIHLKLFFASTYKYNVEYVWLFGRCFDVDDVLHTAKSLPCAREDSQIDDIVAELMEFVSSLEKNHDHEKMVNFMITSAPSISTLWKICHVLEKDAITCHSNAILEKFETLLEVRERDDLVPPVWKDAPRDLKPQIAVLLCTALRKQIEAGFDQRRLVDFILDKDLQEYAYDELLLLLKSLSTSRKVHELDILCVVLNSQNLYSFWQKSKDKDRLDIVNNLTLGKVRSKLCASATKKERLVAAFLATEELRKINVFEAYVDILEQCVSVETVGASALKDIVDAYDEIHKSASELGRKRYMNLLTKSVESHQVDADVKSKLIDSVFTSSTSRSRTDDIDGSREKILLLLLDREFKVKTLGSRQDQHAHDKAIKAVLSEKKLWTVVFQATGRVERLHKHQAFVTVKHAIEGLRMSIACGQIPLEFIKDPKDQREIAELLTLGGCYPPGNEYESLSAKKLMEKWIQVLNSLSKEREKISIFVGDLRNAINLVNELTGEGGTVVVQDLSNINVEYNDLKNRLSMSSTKFADVRKKNYWGSLECLLKPSQDLSKLSNCIIFKNFSRKLLEEEMYSKKQVESDGHEEQEEQEKEETKNGHKSMKVEDVLHLLIDDGKKAFKDVVIRLNDDAGQITSQELDLLLCGIDENSIREEVQSVFEILKLKGPSLKVLKMIQHFLKFDKVRQRIAAAVKCLATMGYTTCGFLQRLEQFLISKDSGTLKSISSRMDDQDILKLNDLLSTELVEVLDELSQSQDLVEFIIKTAKDNMADLVEAVEEHSDQLIQETTVSDLIDVHRFLRGLLTNKPDSPEKFLEEISKAHSNLKKDFPPKRGNQIEKTTKMAAKIKVCSCNIHSLQGLHMMLSNRGEMTKEIIKSAIKGGCYRVEINQNGSIHVQLMYTRHDQKNSKASYNLDDLNNLRSRALLIINAEKTNLRSIAEEQASPVISQHELKRFIEQVDLLTEIVCKYKILQMFGVPKYEKVFWKILNSMEEIIEEEGRVKDEVENWKEMLSEARDKHFFLNYFHAKQLWIIKSFFQKQADVSDEVLTLFRGIDTNITREDVKEFPRNYMKPTSMENELHAIGLALEKIFKSTFEGLPPVVDTSVPIGAIVEPGKLYVSVLEPGSVQTVHVVMALFQNTCARLPKSSQVLFCHSKTTWEEIELLLSRTFDAHRHGITSQLHCIANVESLPNHIEFQLVESLKTLTSDAQSPYLLAVVCRGGSHHYVADQFCDYVHFFGGMPDAELKEKFKQTCPDTFLVTGDLPGLGKSEELHSHAVCKGRGVVTFPISGPFVRRDLVRRLSDLKVKQFQSLHIDIGEVDDPASLDTFLFELIVTKVVSSEAILFSLPTVHVYIEIANTLQQGMRNSLPVCKCFKKLDVSWKDYSNLLISKELTSPIQVVCQYLDAYDRGTLENQEVIFSGVKKAKALSPAKCKALLKKYFFPGGDLSFNILETFISVLADQLMKFTRSPYFKPEHLKDMFEEIPAVRTRLLKALLDVATSFAARSVSTCKVTQVNALREVKARTALQELKSGGRTSADHMVNRVKEMIQWSDNEHLVIMLHGAGAITAIYRDLKNVPQEVKDLFKSQAVHGKGLEDYTTMSQEDLQVRLERISDAPNNQGQRSKLTSLGYALTPDNVLKMALIIQRMQANIPVIVMGETGCGKTSLVRYLAQTCAIPFKVFSFHAGITETQIFDFIDAKDKEARVLQKEGRSMWVFLDEINTCDYLGIINEIVCHRSIYGRPLASNLMFVAACNPYRLRPTGRIMTAGLTGKTTLDEFSKLVYRVHPLPETMIDYVWDYGSLCPEDERAYIGRMVERVFDGKYVKMLVSLLAASQEFIRNEDESSFCVSLRDVHRTTILMKWFCKMLKNRPAINSKNLPNHIQKFFNTAERFERKDRAIVLSLAHCYLSRLPTSDLRHKYCGEMSKILYNHGRHQFLTPDSFQHIIRAEQEDYLSRMELPQGTAKNAALRENVFVILVCILNRIPVFVVGKPGCSKSLSMQIIRSNLRGRDSKDHFFKTLPQLLVVSFQGSESSTSEGIEKVFEKARKYKSKSALPVVLLDEIGLAEVSKFNPLKVLHRLLEPGECEFPDVAVVGISNWALDAAKMNRAIHLSRPEPDQDDLYDTGVSIRQAQVSANVGHVTRSTTSHITCLAEAYYEYQSKQRHDNFHGLRDYYSMVKCLDTSRNPDENNQKIQRAMQRNFGGISRGKTELQSTFLEKLKCHQLVGDVVETPVTDLIRDNLKDKMARHLMIITSGDSAIEILNQTLKDLNKEKITIFGSQFAEDLSADYNHRVLSRIILCMETNCILILRDLESIYGSLYDMLNQNYIVVGGKKNCRVALGAFSNPMCQVNDGFRCIVLVDESKVDYSDPPFLNRFEKQLLRFSDVLTDCQREMINELAEWTERISTIEGHETEFDEHDMFAGFHDDTLPSIVLFHSQDSEMPKEDILKRCKRDLMSIAMTDAVVRSRNSILNRINDEELNELYEDYFEKSIHGGLRGFLSQPLEVLKEGEIDTGGMKLVVMTHSSIHTNVSSCIEGLFQVQVEKLSFFKSEKEITKKIKLFWMESKANLLVVQCRPETDAPHMLLVKTIIEETRKLFIDSQESDQRLKHVCIVIHLRRTVEGDENENHRRWQFNFLSGWKQVTIDTLEKPIIQIRSMLDYSVNEILQFETVSFSQIASDQLLWCFTRLKIPPSTPLHLSEISSLIEKIKLYPEIMKCFKKICCEWIDEELTASNSGNPWQIDVACDRQTLINSSSLVKALEYFISRLVRRPLARIVYFVHKNSAWETLTAEDVTTRLGCLRLISSKNVFNISDIPEPQDPESLVVDVIHSDLHFPFSCLFCKRVDNLYGFFCDEYRRQYLEKESLHESEELTKDERMILTRKVAIKVEQVIMEITDSHVLSQGITDYVDDFLDINTESVSQSLNRQQRVSIMKAHYGDQLPTVSESTEPIDVAYLVAQLHTTFWFNGNVVPEVLYFCQTSTVSLSVEEYVTKFYHMKDEAQEKKKQVASSSHLIDEHREEEEEGELTPKEAKEQYNEQDLNTNALLHFPVEESQPSYSESPGEKTGNKNGGYQKEELFVEDIENENFLETEWCSADEDEDDNYDPTQSNEGEQHEEEREYNANETLEQSFEEFLVQEVCLSLLPTDQFVKSVGGIDEWRNAVNLVLSSVTKYCCPVPVFYYLKVCSDFSSFVLPETKPYRMFVLGELGSTVDDDRYLDSPEVFYKVCELVQDLREEGLDEKKLDEFLFLFFERCIESNPNSCLTGEILKRISSSEDAHMLKLASSILHQIILTEEEAFSLENVEKSITLINRDEFPNLVEINDALSEEEDKELDCHINVICCDLINKLAFKDIDIGELQSLDAPAMKSFHKAMDVVSQFDEECKNKIGFFCAVSYIRAFMSELSRLLVQSDGTFSLELVLNDVCTRLKVDEKPSRIIIVSTFLLKELGQRLCLYDVKQLIQSCEKLHPLRSIGWEGDSGSSTKIVYNPFQSLAQASQAAIALGLQVADSDSKHLKDFLDSAMSSCRNRLEFAAVIAEQFYVVRSIRKLKDMEDKTAKFVTDNLHDVSSPYKSFIVRIAGQESFNCLEIEITPETTTIDVEVAVLIQHLSAILTSGFTAKSKNPVICCLVSPKVLNESYILAAPETASGYHVYKFFTSSIYPKLALSSCECGIRFACHKTCQRKCPCCHRVCEEEVQSDAKKAQSTKGYIVCSPSARALKNELLHVRNLDPIEFRILHVIVHSALFAGYSLGLSTDILAGVMETTNPSDACYQIIQTDLDVLSNILCCKKEKVITLLHHIFQEISQLLTEDGDLPLPHDEKARSSWEGCFSKQIEPLLKQFRVTGPCTNQGDKNANVTLESVIEERALAEFTNVGLRNVYIPRLFRTTQPNTLPKLREVYMGSSSELKDKHPLLGLFLDYHDTLHLISNLAPLLSWSRHVVVLLTRALTRSEAGKMKILNVFTKEQQLQQFGIETASGAVAKEAFEKFRKAWENIVPLMNTKLQGGDKMPYISEMEPVGYCLAERQDLGRYLCTSLIVLAEMQNEFLDKCLAIATSGDCPALQFLFKGGSVPCLPIIHVQDAKEKEIIHYKWSDKVLGHSLYSTEYGQGKNIMYDMGKIEKDMAGNFLLGKAYLSTVQGIREFVFSKQLFHDCVDILNDLSKAIKQENIPSSVEAELASSATKSIDRVQSLLEYLELVLCCLKRSGGKPEESLIDYVNIWMSRSRPFPKDLFPKTLKVIQVKHICALYEFVEDLLAMSSVECVPNEYRQPVLEETVKEMTHTSKEEGTPVLQAIVVAIKRFVFRYVHVKPNPGEWLVEFMKDPSLWPMALRTQTDGNKLNAPEAAAKFFPKELTIGHVYEVYAFYQKRIQEVNAKKARPNIGTISRAPRAQTRTRTGRKRNSKAGGFS